MKKSEPYIGQIMDINSQYRGCGSQVLDGSTGAQPVKDQSLEDQPSQFMSLKPNFLEAHFSNDWSRNVQSLEENSLQFLENQSPRVQSFKDHLLNDHALDEEEHSLKDQKINRPFFEQHCFGIPSFETSLLDESGQLYKYMERPNADVDYDNVRNSEQSADKLQYLMNPSGAFKPQAHRPEEVKSIRKMRQYFFTKVSPVLILIFGYLAIFSIFEMLHPNSYGEQTSEGGIRLVVHPVFVSSSKPTRTNHLGFQPPILSETIEPCQNITLSPSTLTRQKLQIFCDTRSAWSNFIKVRSNSEPFSIESSSPCLEKYIQSNCYDGRQVPNVVHYVWFNRHSLDVYTYLSVISVYKNIRPCLILVHADYLPFGPYWTHLLTLIPNIIHVRTVAPSRVFGRKLGYVQHKSDIARLRILKAHGGIYFDVDQIALKSFDKFRHHQLVMAHESINNLGNAVIISKKMAPFLDLWYWNYNSYNPKQWGYHSTFLPFELSKKYPDLIHIENGTFFDPDLSRMSELYYGHVKWSESMAVHLYVRWMKKYFTLNELRTMNTSLGEIARFIMYDSTTLCEG